VKLRPAEVRDVPVLLQFIRELAEYERALDEVQMDEHQLHGLLFGAKPSAEALVMEFDSEPQGAAMWYESFNTWTGRPGMYIEDVYVRPAFRGRGAGRAVFTYLAALAVERDYRRVEWSVLDWNESAIGFYEELGAICQSEWKRYRLSGGALRALADREQEHG
jgi:ribosomal protein S18 acetylase RimI-like enzyme